MMFFDSLYPSHFRLTSNSAAKFRESETSCLQLRFAESWPWKKSDSISLRAQPSKITGQQRAASSQFTHRELLLATGPKSQLPVHIQYNQQLSSQLPSLQMYLACLSSSNRWHITCPILWQQLPHQEVVQQQRRQLLLPQLQLLATCQLMMSTHCNNF